LRDKARSAEGFDRALDRVELFLSCVGFAALLAGGLGVGGAVRGHLQTRRGSIAILKAMGASGGDVRLAYGLQILCLAQRAFFQEGLGFGAWFIGNYEDAKPVATNFGLPVNLSTQIPRRSGILWESQSEDGRVELMRFVGLEGVDHASRASFTNRGIVSLRLPVANLDAWVSNVRSKNIQVRQSAEPAQLAPYGRIKLAWVQSPNGGIVEAFEVLP